MNYEVSVENIKCGGCANTIRTRLEKLDGIDSVTVDVESGRVTVDGDEDTRENVIERLASLGYPETGSVEGIRSATAKAKSFVSCAVGRMEKTGD
ncbi:MAG: heavy metal-associated domain-containing protein [Xanthomonadales bacterium]|jgi:copper chaperone|nr:heavy metal-associated domain-containing protein [Xanthomonadales bacterium]